MSEGLGGRVINALSELALSTGSLAEAERRAGLSRGHISQVRRRGRVTDDCLTRVLTALGAVPRRFYAWGEATAGRPVLERFGEEALVLAIEGFEPDEVRLLRLAFLQDRLSPIPADQEAMVELARLDDLRYQDSRTAAREVRDRARRAGTAEAAAQALGVWASTLRMEHRLSEAQVILWAGVRLAGAIESPILLGDLTLRVAYVLLERGDLAGALEATEAAMALHQASEDEDRVGRCHVDRGVILVHLGRYPEAGKAFEAGSRMLREDSTRYRATAEQGLAKVIYETGGDLEAARTHARRAEQLLDAEDRARGKILWTRSRIEKRSGDLVEADRLYCEAFTALRRNPADALLIGAERVQLLVDANQPAAACQVAVALAQLSRGLRRDPILSAALADLVRGALEGEKALTRNLVDDVIGRIRRHRAGRR